ncbi:MAG TPA: AbrB/MazE/SpoVT family DNA-binding domain-containing protein, partial [Peptococcaceae bacterium]|nr:AbrB/MazE/SpoVT family DNA-binding domain-containing protein [Peptococcaceae bacterium]
MSIALNKRNMKEMESKIIKISSKKQITIPQAYFEKIGFSEHAECILRDNELVVRPLRVDSDDYSDLILEDLIQQG